MTLTLGMPKPLCCVLFLFLGLGLSVGCFPPLSAFLMRLIASSLARLAGKQLLFIYHFCYVPGVPHLERCMDNHITGPLVGSSDCIASCIFQEKVLSFVPVCHCHWSKYSSNEMESSKLTSFVTSLSTNEGHTMDTSSSSLVVQLYLAQTCIQRSQHPHQKLNMLH